jgi:environmental stress-induced protein Ves
VLSDETPKELQNKRHRRCETTVMTPEQKAALQQHVEAIAEILYADADAETIKSLEGIETTVREQMLEYVSPQVGVFLSEALQKRQQAEREP